jgi:hypothetical protein
MRDGPYRDRVVAPDHTPRIGTTSKPGYLGGRWRTIRALITSEAGSVEEAEQLVAVIRSP